jgi:hypothetical protein
LKTAPIKAASDCLLLMLDRTSVPQPATANVKPLNEPPKQRDVRLDFFRGLAMLIIFVAHMQGNSWTNYIPAQFGFSSGAEMFVLCSGIASGIAFGRLYLKRGWYLGTLRVVQRVWQVYWAHIALTVVVAALYFEATRLLGEPYFERIGLQPLVNEPMSAITSIVSLRFFVTYTDILPMYVVLLAAIPFYMLLAKLHRFVPLIFMVGLWLYIQVVNVWFEGQLGTALHLPSTPDGLKNWFFNPFAWQIVFFTGFAFSVGWLRMPALHKGWLFWVAAAYLLASFIVSSWVPMYWESYWRTGVWWRGPDDLWSSRLWDLKAWISFGKGNHGLTDQQIHRLLHVFAAAYVVLVLIDPMKHWLAKTWAKPIVLVGQQSLPIFLFSTALTMACSILLDQIGRNWWDQSLVNIAGFFVIVLTALLIRYFKSQPWRGQRPAGSAPASE